MLRAAVGGHTVICKRQNIVDPKLRDRICDTKHRLFCSFPRQSVADCFYCCVDVMMWLHFAAQMHRPFAYIQSICILLALFRS